MQFGTFFMMKAKQDNMKCLCYLYSFNLNLKYKEIWSPLWRLNQNFQSPRRKMLVASATVSAAISSPQTFKFAAILAHYST